MFDPRDALKKFFESAGIKYSEDESEVVAPESKPLVEPKPKVDAAPIDTELRDAQDKASVGRKMGAFGSAVTKALRGSDAAENAIIGRFGGSITPSVDNSSIWDRYSDEANQGVADLMSRRKSEAEMVGKREAAAKKALMEDPNSGAAIAFRGFIGSQLSPETAKYLEGKSLAQIHELAPYLDDAMKHFTEGQIAGVKSDQAAKAAAAKAEKDALEAKYRDGRDIVKDKQWAQGEAGKDRRAKAIAAAKAAGKAPPPMVTSIDDVPAELRGTVTAVIEGRAKAPDPGSRFGQTVLNYVTQIDPAFDSTNYGTYGAVKKQVATSKDLVAANTAKTHLALARAHIPENFDAQSINKVKQVFMNKTGSDKLTPFEMDVKIAADELAKAYGNDSEAGRSTIEHLLEPTQSRAQLSARLLEAERLLAGKIETMQKQIDKVAPKGKSGMRLDDGPAHEGGPVSMKFPDGSVHEISPDKIEAAKKKGGVLSE